MHDRNDETSVNDELGENGGGFVRLATVPENQFFQVAELVDRKVGSKSCLHAFFTNDTDANVSFKDHANIITTITYSSDSFAVGVIFKKSDDICFLSWTASTNAKTWC